MTARKKAVLCTGKKKKLMTAVLSLVVVLGMGVSVPAAESREGEWDEFEKGEQNYQYTVNIYAGKEGYFSSTGTSQKSVTVDAGSELSIDIKDLVVNDPDQYYARGMKIAGHDNDEISTRNYQSYTWQKNADGTGGLDQDYNFSVAYGIAGGMVKYTVNYVDESGNPLEASEDYYGMIGDKPVVSYKYVEEYRPNAYNQGKTLVEDESQNVFTFTYKRLVQPTPEPTPVPTAAPTPAPTAAPSGGGGGGSVAPAGTGNTGAPAATATPTPTPTPTPVQAAPEGVGNIGTPSTAETNGDENGETNGTAGTTGANGAAGTAENAGTEGTTGRNGTASETTNTAGTRAENAENAASSSAENGTSGTSTTANGAEDTGAASSSTTAGNVSDDTDEASSSSAAGNEAEGTTEDESASGADSQSDEPAEYIDLDEPDVPLAGVNSIEANNQTQMNNQTEAKNGTKGSEKGGLPIRAKVGIGVAIAAAIAAIIVFLLGKRWMKH